MNTAVKNQTQIYVYMSCGIAYQIQLRIDVKTLFIDLCYNITKVPGKG